jgi:predicted nucleic acid-binding protein
MVAQDVVPADFTAGLARASSRSSRLALGLRDQDDEWVVASAVAGQTEALITSDDDILTERERIPLRAHTPREFRESQR